MTTKNCANVPKLVLKDLCEKSFVWNVLYSCKIVIAPYKTMPVKGLVHQIKKYGLRDSMKTPVILPTFLCSASYLTGVSLPFPFWSAISLLIRLSLFMITCLHFHKNI